MWHHLIQREKRMGRPALDLSGKRFGRLLVLRRSDVGSRNSKWICLCDCGSSIITRGNLLVRGETRSCRCFAAEAASLRNVRHGHAAAYSATPTYVSWRAMLSRVTNPKHVAYGRYGGAGIKVCSRWRRFTNFLADMGERPAGKTLDRFPNPRGHYEPRNCRWATRSEQARNR